MDESKNPDVVSEKAARDARDWVVRLSSGRMTEAELARFKTWRAASEENARAFVRERAFWQQLGALDLHAERERRPRQPASLSRRALVFGGSAAVAASVAVVAVPRVRLLWQADYRTAAGEQRDVLLTDGTRVTLNTDSALAVRYRQDLRSVVYTRKLIQDQQARSIGDVLNNDPSVAKLHDSSGGFSRDQWFIRGIGNNAANTSFGGLYGIMGTGTAP